MIKNKLEELIKEIDRAKLILDGLVVALGDDCVPRVCTHLHRLDVTIYKCSESAKALLDAKPENSHNSVLTKSLLDQGAKMAFPLSINGGEEAVVTGLSQRRYFAIRILSSLLNSEPGYYQTMIKSQDEIDLQHREQLVERAVTMADLLCEWLDKE